MRFALIDAKKAEFLKTCKCHVKSCVRTSHAAQLAFRRRKVLCEQPFLRRGAWLNLQSFR